jgi:hypothetical protein
MNAACHLRKQNNVVTQDANGKLVSMLGSSGSSKSTEIEPASLPVPGERAVVRCAGFQCLAFRDSHGRWREARNKERVLEVLEIVLRF